MTDKNAARFMPQIGHWDAFTGINQDGSVFASYHMAGFPADLAGAWASTALKLSQNQLARNLSDPRIEVWDHFVRQDRQSMMPLPENPTWFGARFDGGYRESQGGDLFRNDCFLTVVMHPEDTFRSGLRALAGGGADAHPQAAPALLQDFADVLHRLEAGLVRYGVRRLGVRRDPETGVGFSEIFEAFHLIANGRFRPIGLSRGRMGRLIVPERVVFDDHRPGEWQIKGEGEPRFGAISSILEYPARTWPTMLDDLRRAPYGVTVTNSWRFRWKAKAISFLSLRGKQMQSGNDSAKSQVLELAQDEDDVMSGRSVYGDHHLSVAVRAGSLDQLDRNVAHAHSRLSDAGITSVRETTAIKAAFHAQIPGNLRWRPRRAPTKSINWVSFAAKNNVPRGRDRGRWGPPIIMLRTTSDTEYALHLQVQGSAQIPAEDLGNCLLIGPAGSGKTSLLGTVCLSALRIPTARVVIVDKDYGLSAMVRAADGAYLVLPSGEPSGLAPLLALSDDPADLDFLWTWCRGLIVSDGGRELNDEEDARLRVAIGQQIAMPAPMRSLAGVAVMLGQRKQDGSSAAARLRKWCRGERLGWAFDNERDELRMDRRIVAFDTTALLKDLPVCAPTLSYLFHRTRKLIDGQPIIVAVDEFWQTEKVPAFAAENNDHLKTIRKNEGVVLLATQSARDALDSPNAHTFKQQVPTKIFFGDDSASRADLVDGMGLTEAEFLAVTQQLPNMRHTFLVKRPTGSVLCRLDLGGVPHLIPFVSGRRGTYELMNRLIARHGARPELWVPHFEREAPHVAAEPTIVRTEEIAA